MQDEQYNYKPVRACKFWSNNYIDYERNSCRNKTLSVEYYLNKIRPNLKDIVNISKNFINFISSKYNDEVRVIHLKADNIELMINDKAGEFIEELF